MVTTWMISRRQAGSISDTLVRCVAGLGRAVAVAAGERAVLLHVVVIVGSVAVAQPRPPPALVLPVPALRGGAGRWPPGRAGGRGRGRGSGGGGGGRSQAAATHAARLKRGKYDTGKKDLQ